MPLSRVWVVPGEGGKYSRFCLGYAGDNTVQGGVNEKGLWLDSFSVEAKPVAASPGKTVQSDMHDKIMAECATLEEVVALLRRYNNPFLSDNMLMVGDRTGASAIIEGNAVLPRRGPYQIITNFRQSEHPNGSEVCGRYKIAEAMLKADPHVSVDGMRKILAAVHQEGSVPTIYSYICDLRNGKLYLYHFHNFENVVVLDVAKELEKGAHVYDITEMFPKTVAAMTFDYLARKELADKKAARLDHRVDAATFPQYSGRYRVTAPEVMAGQTITISAGQSQLYLQLNDSGKWEVLPDSPASFFLLGYGGTDLSCRFARDATERVTALAMEGAGLSLAATKVE